MTRVEDNALNPETRHRTGLSVAVGGSTSHSNSATTTKEEATMPPRRATRVLCLFVAFLLFNALSFVCVSLLFSRLYSRSADDVANGYTSTTKSENETIAGQAVFLMDVDAMPTGLKLTVGSCCNGVVSITFGRVRVADPCGRFARVMLHHSKNSDAADDARDVRHWRVGFCGFLFSSSSSAAAGGVEDVAWVRIFDMSHATGKDDLFRFDLQCGDGGGGDSGAIATDDATPSPSPSKRTWFFRFFTAAGKAGKGDDEQEREPQVDDDGDEHKEDDDDDRHGDGASPPITPTAAVPATTVPPVWRTCEASYARYFFGALWYYGGWKYLLAYYAAFSLLTAAALVLPVGRYLRQCKIHASRWSRKAQEKWQDKAPLLTSNPSWSWRWPLQAPPPLQKGEPLSEKYAMDGLETNKKETEKKKKDDDDKPLYSKQ